MELTWSDSEIPLSSFVKQYTLPQIVQIGEGVYGEDEERTLSRGQELNLHIMKERQCFFGLTECGDETYIPLNSPNMVHVYYERSLTPEERTPAKLCSLFPKKYTRVSLSGSNDGDDASDSTQTLRALYFDKDMQALVCLDIQGCEIVLDSCQLKKVTINDKSDEAMFIAEVNNRFKLPFTVKFLPSEGNCYLPRGLIHLQEIVNRHTIVATSRDVDSQSILTFCDTLEVTVFPPEKTTVANPEYQKLCQNLNVELNIEEIEKTIEKDDQVYDDVKIIAKISPYAESFFGKRFAPAEKLSEDEPNVDEDEEGYVDIDGLFPKGKPSPQLKKSTTNTTSEVSEGRDSDGNSDGEDYEAPEVIRTVSKDYEKRFVETRRKIMESNRKTEDLTVQEIGLLLHDLNLSQYGGTFEQEQVDGKMLNDLNKEVLQSHFKMTAFHAHKLKKATTENWRPSIRE